MSSSINLDLITSDQYAAAYLDYFFSDKGPVAGLQNYFMKASDNLKTFITQPGCKNKTVVRHEVEQSDGARLKDQAEGLNEEQRVEKEDKQCLTEGREGEAEQRDENVKLSIVETQPDDGLQHNRLNATSA